MKIPGHLRTLRSECKHFGHDFEEDKLCLTYRDGKYYIEHWNDPIPGGYGCEFRVRCMEISAETAQLWSFELIEYYTKQFRFP